MPITTSCDLCGKTAVTAKAKIEGVELSVCEPCSKFGKLIGSFQAPKPKIPTYMQRPKREESESNESIVDEFATIIRQAREKRKMSQQDFAKLVQEKESAIHSIENGSHRPSIDLARKLERILHITLTEVVKDAIIVKSKSTKEAFTLGDFIKIRK